MTDEVTPVPAPMLPSPGAQPTDELVAYYTAPPGIGTLATALENLAAVMPHIDDAASALTCSEAETIAHVLGAAGYPVQAAEFIRTHAYGDEEGDDEHHDLWHEVDPEMHPVADCGWCQPDDSDEEIERRKEDR